MAGDEDDRRGPTIKLPQWALILAMGSGLGGIGSWGANKIDPPRKDPFTGTQGHQLESRLQKQVDAINRDLGAGESREHNNIFACIYRVNQLEKQMEKHHGHE